MKLQHKKQKKIMSGKIKIGETVDTPNGRGVVVNVERYKQFRRWAVLLESSPFSFNPVWYHHKKLILTFFIHPFTNN